MNNRKLIYRCNDLAHANYELSVYQSDKIIEIEEIIEDEPQKVILHINDIKEILNKLTFS